MEWRDGVDVKWTRDEGRGGRRVPNFFFFEQLPSLARLKLMSCYGFGRSAREQKGDETRWGM